VVAGTSAVDGGVVGANGDERRRWWLRRQRWR